MTIDLEREELRLLERARRAHEPSPVDVARVLQKTRVAIAAGAAVTGAAAGVGFWAKHGAGGSVALKGSLVPKLLVALAIAGAGAIGYGAGYQQARRHAALVGERTHAVREMGPGMEPPQARAATNHLLATEAAEPGTAATDPIEETRGERAREPKPRRKPIGAASVEVADAGGEPSQTLLTAPASLSAELTALRRVERALREHAPERALSLLERLDAEVPQGRLLEERAAARAMAECSQGRAARDSTRVAMQRVLEFSRAYPASVYFARVRGTCLQESDAGSPTDSDSR